MGYRASPGSPSPVPRQGLSRAGGGRSCRAGTLARRGFDRGGPAAPPWCDNLGSSSLSSSPCGPCLPERSASPASRTHDAHVVGGRSFPCHLPPGSPMQRASWRGGFPTAQKVGAGQGAAGSRSSRSACGGGVQAGWTEGGRVALTCAIFQIWKPGPASCPPPHPVPCSCHSF